MQINSWQEVLDAVGQPTVSMKYNSITNCGCYGAGSQRTLMIYTTKDWNHQRYIVVLSMCNRCFAHEIREKDYVEKTCPKCDKKYHITKFTEDLLSDSHGTCPYCDLFQCRICGSPDAPNSASLVGMRSSINICDSCYNQLQRCHNCGNIHSPKKATSKKGILHRNYCPRCWQSNSIGEWCFKPENTIVCYPKYVDYNVKIQQLNYKSVLLGIELEAEISAHSSASLDHIARDIQEDSPFFYCVHDGSLVNGLEIISVPMSFAWIQQHLGKELGKIRKHKALAAAKRGKCGMHIHMNRKAISNLQLFKMINFIETNEKFCLRVAQRKNLDVMEQYASFRPYSPAMMRVRDGDPGGQSRYQAINLQNRYTVELRFFQGTLNPRTIMKNIEFFMALYDFSRDTSLKEVVVSKFVEYIKKFKYRYPHLESFLQCIVLKDIPDSLPRSQVSSTSSLMQRLRNTRRTTLAQTITWAEATEEDVLFEPF